ncbi:MAG: hypothetical protein OXC11_03290 [Rhodospirillales bacterium]|nr:hypothetical protein [Rhodospirillales bacterium]
MRRRSKSRLKTGPGVTVGTVPNSFRSSFRDRAWERTCVPGAVAELALARVEKDKTVAAHARSGLFERRRKLMVEWADYLADQGTQARGDRGRDSALA